MWICFLVGGLEPWNFLTVQILGMSLSQLTNSIIFQRGGEKPPTSFCFLWRTWGSSTSDLDFTGACVWTKPHPLILFCRYGFETKDRLIVPFNRGRDKVKPVLCMWIVRCKVQSSVEHGSGIFNVFAQVLLVSCSNYWSIFVDEPCVILSLFKMCCWHDIYLVGLEHFLFSHILGIIIPTDFHIFQKGWNHQPVSLHTNVFVFNIRGRLHQSDDAMFTISSGVERAMPKNKTLVHTLKLIRYISS